MKRQHNPTPRKGHYYGMEIQNVEHANGTWLEGEEFAYPNGGMTRRCYALWEDGTRRVVYCGIPDTFFTAPAYGRKQGRHIAGFVMSDDLGFHFIETKGQDHESQN